MTKNTTLHSHYNQKNALIQEISHPHLKISMSIPQISCFHPLHFFFNDDKIIDVSNTRAQFIGRIPASQAREVGSIPIARSIRNSRRCDCISFLLCKVRTHALTFTTKISPSTLSSQRTVLSLGTCYFIIYSGGIIDYYQSLNFWTSFQNMQEKLCQEKHF